MQPHERSLHGCLRLLVVSSIALVSLAAVFGVAARQILVKEEAPSGYIGSPRRGRELLTAYGCPACHDIPGAETRGMVGPPLTHIASRSYLAGRIPNERIDMEQWLRHPQQLKPNTAMPNLGVTERDARDIATYLATLK
jgi:cytochrome c1